MSITESEKGQLSEVFAPWNPGPDGRPTYQEIISQDMVAPAQDSVLRDVTYEQFGTEEIPADRYYSREYFALEIEHVWKKQWQPACHESQIANVGDVFLYEVAGTSALITRVGPTSIKAYHNSCLHRGTQLRRASGSAKQFKCPFHGFTWNLDGTFAWMPCEWDFPHIDKEKFALPELQVDTWAGFVFVNPDPGASSLAEHLGEVVDHFRPWRPENRVLTVRASKPVRANWKVATEAFLETFHVIGVHRQQMPSIGDSNSQYDIYWPNVSRMLTALNVSSPHLGLEGKKLPEQEIVELVMESNFAGVLGEGDELARMLGSEMAEALKDGIPEAMKQLPPGYTARSWMAELTRAQVRMLRDDVKDELLSDAEVGDAIVYNVFPNFTIAGGFGFGISFWFRPVDEEDPESCVFEIFLSRPGNGEGEAPIPAAYELSEEDSFLQVREFAGGGKLFDQDLRNVPRVQSGLRHAGRPGLTLTKYTEVRIRHLHALLDRCINGAE